MIPKSTSSRRTYRDRRTRKHAERKYGVKRTPATPAADAIRIVVVDDAIVRNALVRCLELEPDFQVVGKFATGAIDVAVLGSQRPHLVLMDIEIPEQNGIEVMRALRAAFPKTRIVVLTGSADGELLLDAMQAGAVGYVLKRARPAELLATLRRVIDGEHVLPPILASRFLLEFQSEKSKQHQAKLAELSPREDEVLRLLATGKTNRQIAKHLFVSDETVKSHVAAILRRLQVPDRTRAAIFAIRAGLIDA